MILDWLSKALRVRTDEVEAVLRHDAGRAKETVARRAFMGTFAAIAAAPFVPSLWIEVGTPPSITLENFDALLKELYLSGATDNLSVFGGSRLLSMLPKESSMFDVVEDPWCPPGQLFVMPKGKA